MPYDVKRFIFSVSLCAMLVANPVLATAPTNDEDLGTTHDVYVESNLNKAANGIAGVGYVNRMVDAAGNAAQAAEGHAAAAGEHALSAAKSAAEAHAVLSDKVNIAQGTDNKNKAMVTNASGYVAPGYITSDMISSSGYSETSGVLRIDSNGGAEWGAIEPDMINSSGYSGVLIANAADAAEWGAIQPDWISATGYSGVLVVNSGVAGWGYVGEGMLAEGAVTTDKIASGTVITSTIADGAVTIKKTAGVVGMVPVGSAGATTYGQFWIE